MIINSKKKKVIDDDDDDRPVINNIGNGFQTPSFKRGFNNNVKENNTNDSNNNSMLKSAYSDTTHMNKLNLSLNEVSSILNSIDDDDEDDTKIKAKKKTPKTTNPKKKKTSSNSLVSLGGNDQENQEQILVNPFANPEIGLPEFLRPENIRDKNNRCPDDPNYDPTTLFIPQNFMKKATPAMQQFWSFKQDNFDKVLLFKLGKFYEMFYDDAIVGNQVLDLKWMGNDPNKLHVGFPEKILEEKAAKLVQYGFKVAVVEQTEKEKDRAERLEKAKSAGEKSEKTVKRELCNVFTKGTYQSQNQSNNTYNNKYCIALHYDNKNTWGYVIFDVSTLNFYFGEITDDDESYNKIMTLLYNIKPEEVIEMKGNLPTYIQNFLISLSSKPQMTTLKNEYALVGLQRLCEKYFGQNLESWNNIIVNYLMNEDKYRNVCSALYITIVYLEKILLAEQCLKIGNFSEFYDNVIVNKRLIMDYQAITNLELIETKLDPRNPENGSLLEYMNRAVSPFGKRLFKTWLLNPLANIDFINERLEIIDNLIANSDLLNNFRSQLSKWPDLERQVTKIYKFAMQTSSKAVYFEDISKTRLQDFFNVINFLKKSVDLFKIFDMNRYNLTSAKLIEKLIFIGETANLDSRVINGIVHNIKEELEDFTKNFLVKSDSSNGCIVVEPADGVYEEYDKCKEIINEFSEQFDAILEKEKKRLKCDKITYAHTKFYKYEMEIPEDIVKGDKKPKNYILTTSKKGYIRFHTQEIIDKVNELENYQEKLKKEITKFNLILFNQFYMKSGVINAYIKNIAELDCLSSLALVSSQVNI